MKIWFWWRNAALYGIKKIPTLKVGFNIIFWGYLSLDGFGYDMAALWAAHVVHFQTWWIMKILNKNWILMHKCCIICYWANSNAHSKPWWYILWCFWFGWIWIWYGCAMGSSRSSLWNWLFSKIFGWKLDFIIEMMCYKVWKIFQRPNRGKILYFVILIFYLVLDLIFGCYLRIS